MGLDSSLPNLNYEIIPGESAAGFYLNMEYKNFLDATENVLIENHKQIAENKNQWCIFKENYISSWDRKHHRDIYCYWENSVILIFSGEQLLLTRIELASEFYRGKIFGRLGIGDRLDLLADEYDFLFERDWHYLAKKQIGDAFLLEQNNRWENREICEGLAIHTNYLVKYSQEYADQIVKRIAIF